MYSIQALIVEDSSVVQKIVERSLRQAGIELSKVFEAGNGAEGLAVLAENRVGDVSLEIFSKYSRFVAILPRLMECQ